MAPLLTILQVLKLTMFLSINYMLSHCFFLTLYPDYVCTFYTSTAFISVIWDPEYIRMGWLRMFEKCRFQFSKPTAYLNMTLSADYPLIFEHQQSLNSNIFLDLLYNWWQNKGIIQV
jgi:hypothetical protein